MLYTSQSNAQPVRVKLEQLPDRNIVWLTDNVHEVELDGQTTYEYDEAMFNLPEDREETVASITESFAGWWLYGQEEHTEPTLEERVSLLEDILMEM